MSFPKTALAPKVLKSGQSQSVNVAFKTKSDGQTFSGNLNVNGTGSMKHEGFDWMGFNLSNQMDCCGTHNVGLSRTQNLAGRDIKLTFGLKHQMTMKGEVTMGANTTFSRQFRGAEHNFYLDNTAKLGVDLTGAEGSNMFGLNSNTTTLNYMNSEGNFGTTMKMGMGNGNAMHLQQFGWMNKFGGHTFGVDTRWNPRSEESRYGFKSATVYGQSKVGDWDVGVSVAPEMKFDNFAQQGSCTVGVSGDLNDQVRVHGVFNRNDQTATTTAQYTPNGNVDVMVHNQWSFNEESADLKDQFKPTFTINLHD